MADSIITVNSQEITEALSELLRWYCQVMEHACPTLPPDARFVACSGLYSGFASHLRQK